MRVSLMKNGYSQCVICHYYGDVFLHYAIFVAECEFMSIRDDILSRSAVACCDEFSVSYRTDYLVHVVVAVVYIFG